MFLLHELNIDDIENTDGPARIWKDFAFGSEVSTRRKRLAGRVIQLWMDGEVRMKKPSDDSIEERVERHLLTFDKLRAVWLGAEVRSAKDHQ
jgi:hypothetical protein